MFPGQTILMMAKKLQVADREMLMMTILKTDEGHLLN